MQNRQNGRRRRGGGQNTGPRPMGMASGGQNTNRLEVRVRGNAHQLLEKYKQLARDAHQGGDRVAAEYYLQHADHYFRVLNDSRIRQEEMRARRSVFDQYDDDAADAEEAAAENGEESGEGAEGQAPRENMRHEQSQQQQREMREPREPREERGPRREYNRNDGYRDNRREGGQRDREQQQDRGGYQERSNGYDNGGRYANRDRRPRERAEYQQEAAAEVAVDSAAVRMSDGEAALMAFGGTNERVERVERVVERAVESAAERPAVEVAETTVVVEEKPRRPRGRPRKVPVEAVEG